MRKLRKMLALFCIMMFSATLLVPATYAASFSDVPSNYRYSEAISNLTAFGIIEGFDDGTFKPEETVTRAQFAAMICRALNVGNVPLAGNNTSFPDVAADHWAAANIETAVSMGIINGYDDGLFRPEDPVLYEQAVKMVVCARQLGSIADLRGGYPDGHMQVASSYGFLKDINDGIMKQSAKRGTIAQLIYNMRTTEIDTGNGNGNLGNNIDSGETVRGQVVSVYGTTIYPNRSNPCGRNEIEIETNSGDFEVYSIANLSGITPSNYLGRMVNAYYNQESGVDIYELRSIELQSGRNIVTSVDLSDILDASDNSATYLDEDGDEISIDIESDANILFNGVPVADGFGEIYNDNLNKTGSVEFLQARNSGIADVIFIKTYTTIVVNSIDSTNYRIYDRNNPALSYTLDETDRSKSITFTRNGEPAEFRNISVGNIVSIAESSDKTVYEVLISTERTSGNTITSISSEYVQIGDTRYELSDSLVNKDELEVGTTGSFYLDAFGKIAYADISASSSYSYGYLTGVNVSGNNATGYTLQIQLIPLGTTASVRNFTVGSGNKTRVTINGEPMYVSTDVDAILSLLETDAARAGINPDINGEEAVNDEYAQLIKYSTTSSTSSIIDTILTNSSTGSKENTLSVNTQYTTTPIQCTMDGARLGSYAINSNTKILVVPTDRTDHTRYQRKSASYFESGEEYYVQLADIDDGNLIGAIIVFENADTPISDFSEDDAPMIVTDTGASYVDGEELSRITVLTADGASEQYYEGESGDADLSSVAVGDIIRVVADSSNYVELVEIVTSAADVVSGRQEAGVYYDAGTSSEDQLLDAPYRVLIGLAQSMSENTLIAIPSYVANDPDGEPAVMEEVFLASDNPTVISIDTAASKDRMFTEEAGMDAIRGAEQVGENDASRIMVYTKDGRCELVVIFK